jgi:hypothetical protein
MPSASAQSTQRPIGFVSQAGRLAVVPSWGSWADPGRLGVDRPRPHWLRLAPRALGSFGESFAFDSPARQVRSGNSGSPRQPLVPEREWSKLVPGSFGETTPAAARARRLGPGSPVPHWLRFAPRVLGSFEDGRRVRVAPPGRLDPDQPGARWLRSAHQALGSFGDGCRVRSASGVEFDSPPPTNHSPPTTPAWVRSGNAGRAAVAGVLYKFAGSCRLAPSRGSARHGAPSILRIIGGRTWPVPPPGAVRGWAEGFVPPSRMGRAPRPKTVGGVTSDWCGLGRPERRFQ